MTNEPKEILTEEDKKFICENYKSMNIMQMAVRLNIKTENRKCPIISDFIRQANLQQQAFEAKPVAVEVPSNTLEDKVNDILGQKPVTETPTEVDTSFDTNISIDAFAAMLRELNLRVREPLTEREKHEIRFLMNQMQSTRYIQIYKTLRRTEFKRLFQEEFIKSMFGKGEMPQEEVNDFIDLCCEMVQQYDYRCKIKDLEKLRDDAKQNDAMKIALVNSIIELNDKIALSTKRASEIKKSLGTLREQRIKEHRNVGLTMSSLIESVMNEEKRDVLVSLQKEQDAKLVEALNKIDILEETKALIMGISKDELLKGGL